MTTNIHTQLENTRHTLRDLGNAVSDLVNSSPDVFTDPAIRSRLEDFRKAHQEATQRLAHPTLSIATIGTTSSGKSTVVNSLMGRRIAPIEAGEMSGGVLTLKHSDERKLLIEATLDAVWETGEWAELSDEEMYNRIQMTMHSYHETRKKKECIAPQITVSAALFPACDLSLSGLPEGIGIEFLDLPGLKSVQDRANLAVIQPLVGKAFSLVALDYMQVDEQHRQKLLGELKRVVEYLQGRTDSMIFILNRVDNRGSDDLALEVRLEKLKEEIKEVLSLTELPDVIPFNARLLYYAQCAWGTTALKGESTVKPEVRSQLLKSMFVDCAAVIKDKTSGDRDLRNWLRGLEDDLDDGHTPDDYKMRRIMFYALNWSGGEALWNCVRKRVQESFSELVILPALLDVFNNFDALANTLDILIETHKITNQEQVKAAREKITKIRQDLQKNVKRIGSDFQKEVKSYIEALKNDDPKIRIKIKEDAEKKGRKGFSLIFDAVKDVEGDLTISLISSVRDAFEKNQGAYDLEDKLREVITPPLAKDIAGAYDNVSRRMSKFSLKSDSLSRKVRADDQKGQQDLEHDQKYFRLLYHTMRQAITARAEFTLQTKAKQFEEALHLLVDDQLKRLQICLSEQELSSIDIEQAAISDLRKKLAENLPTLPEKFFELPDTIQQKSQKQSEVVGTETYTKNVTKIRNENRTESYTEGSCFKETKTRTKVVPVEYIDTEQRTRNQYADIEYVELFLPSPKLMAQQWSEGITKGKDSLWDILCNWITARLDNVSGIFEESVIDITNLAERALNEQLKIIELNFEEQKQLWANFEVEQNKVTQVRSKLENEAREK
jgi:hypothetical protein